MSPKPPSVIVLAGPNGAGKSTVAPRLLKGKLAVTEFVNADVIARGLSAFNSDSMAIAAGRIMLRPIKQLATENTTFAFEATLASQSFAPWLTDLTAMGYRFHLLYLWLPNAEMALARVADRVRFGGHDVPEETVRRRYRAGLRNFLRLCQPLTTSCRVYDNSRAEGMSLIASGQGNIVGQVRQERLWQQIVKDYGYE